MKSYMSYIPSLSRQNSHCQWLNTRKNAPGTVLFWKKKWAQKYSKVDFIREIWWLVRESGRSVLYPGEFAYYALTLFLLLDSPEPLFRRIFFGLDEFRKNRYQVLHFTFSELDALLQTVSLLFSVVVKTAASISFICCLVL